ncbi:MAG: heavy-metal-associated domain-containing protein [Gammaproteobacteria bacterium]|nr:heavy-metal-associated domain-containing protein [Gammaproteobacteria bacterium]
MIYEISVENIKCGGCAGTITKKINEIEGVNSTNVEIETGLVKIDAVEGLRDTLVSNLLKLGYPETGTAAGMAAAKAKAKSFVSCAVGRINADK